MVIHRNPGSARHAGFSLIELMVVLVFLSILATLATGGFATVLMSMRLSAANDTLLASLQRARMQAVLQGTRVVMCISSSGTACTLGGSWHEGWILFQDPDHDGQLGPGEWIFHQQQALPTGVQVHVKSKNLKNYISFVRHGGARMVSQPASELDGRMQIGRLNVCSPAQVSLKGHQIVMRGSGQLRNHRLPAGVC